MTDSLRPPIPARLSTRPVVGGLAAPWVNVALAGGGVDFRIRHNSRWEHCWRHSLCQACGQPLTVPMVFLGGPNQLERMLFDEPPLHPECAAYATRACPMVAGRMATYPNHPSPSQGDRGKRCYDPDCDCAGWVPTPGIEQADHGGEPAHPWYAVWARSYALAVTPENRLIGGQPEDVRRTRHISTPPTSTEETR